MSSPERWEVTQLIKSGVLDVTEYPTFDEEGGTVREGPSQAYMALHGHRACLVQDGGLHDARDNAYCFMDMHVWCVSMQWCWPA